MKTRLAYSIAILGWFAVIMQFFLMLMDKTMSSVESIERFFSYFTILTNTIVALFFTMKSLNFQKVDYKTWLTPIAVYITVVCVVYQTLLRSVWTPEGFQIIIDELLHSIIPVLTVVYWFLYDGAKHVVWSLIPKWLIYPLVYLIYILTRGMFSGFYPYPFINVLEIGWQQTLINSVLMCLLFLMLFSMFIGLGQRLKLGYYS
ncbi:Pr6Pr family membrane protein [Aestuariibaculum lutulentum]|uniref:Pr6Pr family membrane protein n=1 Tax=Aestuariibaculum lutulentum TaxID=2920935 RepID=A0ABS9RKI7_9FLAO|nr:Pr6Pr family membrane protein [Aestuariibaculum lutulentum]MCH4553463.1 Pr6Pr family membrane protein [Aestuariibaculum lutulentum]